MIRLKPLSSISLFAVAFTLLLSGCFGGRPEANVPKKPVVRYVNPVEQEVTDYEYFTGRTDAVESVDIRARVTGYLMEIGFESGKDVKKDQQLFKIDPRPYQAALDQANGQLELAKARLKLAEADLARAKALAKTPGAISQQDIDKFAAAEAQGLAAVDATRAQVESAKLNLEFTDVTAPISGLASRNLLTIGNLINQDQTLLTTIVSQDPIYAYFDVDEVSMLRVQKLIRDGAVKSVRAGGKVPIDFGLSNEGEEFPHEGVLDFVNNRVDATTGTLQVRGVLENPSPGDGKPRLLSPGMFLRVRFPIGMPHKSWLIPQSAVGTDQGRKYLLVINDKNIVEYRPINVGAIQPDGLQVVVPIKQVQTPDGNKRPAHDGETGEDSLSLTDKVIVGGLQRVRPGVEVEAKPTEAKSL